MMIYTFIIAFCTLIHTFKHNHSINSPILKNILKRDHSKFSNLMEKYRLDSVNEKGEYQTPVFINEEKGNLLPGKNQLLNVEDSSPVLDRDDKLYIDKSIIYTMPNDDYIVVGKILGVYGLNGQVKIKSYTSQPEIRLCEPGYRYLKIPFNDERVIPIKIERGKCSGNKDEYIVKFEGFDNVEQSQRITNTYLTIPFSEMPPLEENTYYSRDLIGLNLYLYNDINKTNLGQIVGFVHRSDLATRKKYEEICEDLIDVQLNMKLSLQTLINVANASKLNSVAENKKKLPSPTIVTERELEEADDIVDMSNEFNHPYFKSMLYVKYYECSKCKKEFTNQTLALLHEREHEGKGESRVENESKAEDEENKLRIISIDEMINDELVIPIRRFYVPLVKDETVKYIDVENKSVYVDPYTIFIGEDPNSMRSLH